MSYVYSSAKVKVLNSDSLGLFRPWLSLFQFSDQSFKLRTLFNIGIPFSLIKFINCKSLDKSK
jgi:hypothetical protein